MWTNQIPLNFIRDKYYLNISPQNISGNNSLVPTSEKLSDESLEVLVQTRITSPDVSWIRNLRTKTRAYIAEVHRQFN